MPNRIAVLTLAIVSVGSVASACSGSETKESISSNDPDVTAATTASTMGRLSAFCVEFALLQGDRQEPYVGSEEHLFDIERLLSVAPEPLAAHLATFRDFVASGAIDSETVPDSNLTENWPADVQSAIESTQSFAEANC